MHQYRICQENIVNIDIHLSPAPQKKKIKNKKIKKVIHTQTNLLQKPANCLRF